MHYQNPFPINLRRYTDISTLASISVVVFTMVFYLLFQLWSNLAEWIYGGVFYPAIRSLYDYTFAHLLFPTLYLILPLLLYFLFVPLFTSKSFIHRIGKLLLRALLILSLFYLLWGFNYMRPNLKEKLVLESPEVDAEELFCYFLNTSSALHQTPPSKMDHQTMKTEVKKAVTNWLKNQDLPFPGNPPMRFLKPSGILLGINTAGIYMPFSMEPHIDAGLHPLIQPFVLAHEISHAYGITDEGECNFIGAVACLNSSSVHLQYASHLQQVRWLFYPLIRLGYSAEELRNCLPEQALKDLKAIREHHDGFPTYFPDKWRNAIYNQYLKSQGVQSGLQSYGEVVGLLMAWDGRSDSPSSK